MDSVTFTPSRVEGMSGVESVTVYPDRLTIQSHQGESSILFSEIALRPSPGFLSRLVTRLRLKPRWLPVADRDWFHSPPDMFFRFYTKPALTIYMPVDEVKEPYSSSHFVQIQEIMLQGGFHSIDLG
ncbi:MAG: hypothetical protein AAF711_12915 [Planctomycetota bacterium]